MNIFQNSFSSAQNIFIINLDAIVALNYRPVAIAIFVIFTCEITN